MGDALFRLTSRAIVDVVAVPIASGPGEATRETARAVLSYVAADVNPDALTLLALLPADGEGARGAADFAAAVRAAFAGVAECEAATEATAGASVVLLFAPRARLSCRSARVLDGGHVLILELATRA